MDKATQRVLAAIGILTLAVCAMGAVMQGVDSTGHTYDALVDSSGRLQVELASTDDGLAELVKNPWDKLDDDAVANCVAITDTSAQFTLPGSAGDWYCMSATDNNAYVLCGTNPTATTTVTTGFAFIVHEGSDKCRRLTGAKCAVIGTVTAGSLCFEHLNPAL